MEAAKAAVNKLTGHRGHHTTVEETVNPAVTRETVKPHRHEEATQAIDREVHQDHYHTTVQPIQHQEILPEKHQHNLLPTEHREFRHDNEDHTKQRIAADLGHFKDHSVTHETRHTQAAAPTVTGEHVHHHVHETVVPVINKETIQPEVVHTTVPIHETHHAAAQHHGLSALPTKTLAEFKQAGGALTGGSHGAHEQYDGPPRPYNDKMSTTFDKLGLKHGHHGTTDTTSTTTGSSGIGGRHEQTGTSGIGGHHDHTGTRGTTDSTGLSGDRGISDNRGTSGGILGTPSGSNRDTTGTSTGTGGLASDLKESHRHGESGLGSGTGGKMGYIDNERR